MKNFKKIFLSQVFFSLLFFYYCETARAQLVVNTGVTTNQLIAGFIGSGITVSNPSFTCLSGGFGTFSNGNTTNIGITNGAILTTGCASGIIGSNNSASYGCSSTDWLGFCNYSVNDPDLQSIEPQATWDPCILTFSVTPSCSTLTIQFVFGSEEYPEFVGAGYNDAFGFFVTGPNPSGPAYVSKNIALLPTGTAVSIDNVNGTTNSTYYNNNAGGATIQYDGFTDVITSNLSVTPCAVYKFKIAIADAGDCVYDSGVLLQKLFCSSAVSISTSSIPTCSCNGSATASVTSGQPPYTYSWNNGQTTSTATGLCPGNYTVTVTDQTGCVMNSNSSVVTVGSVTPGTASIQSSTNTACSSNTGSATATMTGGTGPFTYTWNTTPAQNTQTAVGLSAGTYIVTVTDANGCSASTSVTIGNTAGPSVTATGTQAGCTVANGSATATPSGGTSPFTYLWNTTPVQNTQTANNLSAGTYSVTVTDANGCSATTSVTITSTANPTVSASGTQAGCTVANGSASATPSGGTSPFTYLWNTTPAQNTQTANNLSAGTYIVIATDANGCSATTSVTITTTNGPAVSATGTQAGCTVANGSATATPSGGTSPFTYLWNTTPVQNTQTANNLSAGTYTVTVTDANGCSAFTTVTISSTSNIPSAAASANNNVSCFGLSDGSATATGTGGTPGYNYSWNTSPVQNTQTANNLSAGTYSVTITDANGCSAVASVLITAPPVITLTANSSSVTCSGYNNGSATANASGGTPGYTYSWNTTPVQNTQTANNLSAGTYQCTVTDSKGCTKVTTVTITQPQALSASTTPTNVSCNGGSNGSASANPSGGTPGYTYLWNTTPAQSTQTANNLPVGSYIVTVKDANGCTKTATVTITQPAPITYTVSGNDSICTGANTLLTAIANGGTPAYTYVWNPGPNSGTSFSVNPTASTSYSVSISDASGCGSSSNQIFNVTVLPGPNALFDSASTGIYGSLYSFTDLSTPSVTITAWNWNFGDGSSSSALQNPVHTFPGAGTYTVTEVAYNQFGCPDTFKLTIHVDEGILIPNVFTPDGDGVNDVWYIPNSGMKEFHVELFDRWGAKVWETTADEIRWDGHSSSGKLLTDGTYYFVLHAILKSGSKGKDYSTTGYVTLLTKKK